jgi:hypothetical protein
MKSSEVRSRIRIATPAICASCVFRKANSVARFSAIKIRDEVCNFDALLDSAKH